MTSTAPDPTQAFRALTWRLATRRAGSIGTRLWLVTLVLVLCVGAFTYWQVRVPLDGVVRHDGPLAGAQRLALVLAAFALAGGALAASRQVALAAAPPGPEWLTLPIAPRLVERHLAREASMPALAVWPGAAAAWLAGWGLLPTLALSALPPAFFLAWWGCARVACYVALRAASPASGPARRMPAAWRALVAARRPIRATRVAAAPFRSESRWRALARLDRAVSSRAGSPRARLAFAALFMLLSAAVWLERAPNPLVSRALAFAAFTIGCAGLGSWAAWRAAGDPPSAVRPLPLKLADAWRARAFPLFAAIGLALLLQLVVAAPLTAPARVALALTWLVPALLLILIGLHLGLSLPGGPALAENLYYGWLGVGMVASIAIPLFGWGMLVAALLHATRRLPRWYTPEAG